MYFFWFRRDLRLKDNAGLFHALRSGQPILPVFIFDRHILDALQDRRDARVQFIHQTLQALQAEIRALGSELVVEYGHPEAVWPQLLARFPQAKGIFSNRDYEPYALERDAKIRALVEAQGGLFEQYKDQVIFEHKEVAKADNEPYTVFTPYSRRWRERLHSRPDAEYISEYLRPYPTEQHWGQLLQTPPLAEMPSLAAMGFESLPGFVYPPNNPPKRVIKDYAEQRNFPAKSDSTSRLGLHFRFGTISIREKALKAWPLSETYVNELIWRDFYAMILANFPHVAKSAFRPAYDKLPWRRDEADFKRWCEGKTGYPLVDAGMRELNQTGFMHNRVRMVVASFLTKHLFLDWRWGEAYFAQKLLDFDLASNNGGWQWAMGGGTDAAPYFRIFNPEAQAKKFDPQGLYIKKYVPEYGTAAYPTPMVEHSWARQRCLDLFKGLKTDTEG